MGGQYPLPSPLARPGVDGLAAPAAVARRLSPGRADLAPGKEPAMNHLPSLSGDQVFQVGHYFVREGRLFQITAWTPGTPLDVEACTVEDGVVHCFTLTDLFAAEPVTQFGATPDTLVVP